jgi:hypothetical protein
MVLRVCLAMCCLIGSAVVGAEVVVVYDARRRCMVWFGGCGMARRREQYLMCACGARR